MKIEEELRSRQFDSSYHKAVVNLFFTYNWLEQELSEVFKKFELPGQHFNVLRILHGAYPDPVTPSKIKSVMIEKGRDLTRLLDKLDNMGLIERGLDVKNRRQVLVSITQKGRKLEDTINTALISKIRAINRLSGNEAILLNDLLDKMRSQ